MVGWEGPERRGAINVKVEEAGVRVDFVSGLYYLHIVNHKKATRKIAKY